MTPEQIQTLVPALAGFHQDFDLDDTSEREVLVMHARGLDDAGRQALYAALEALLMEARSDNEFRDACRAVGSAHFPPTRAEFESFVAWAHSPEGAAVIAGPGPTSEYFVVHVDLHPT